MEIDMHATIEKLLEATFSVQSVLRPYSECHREKLAVMDMSHSHKEL
jgi:hypothetical protein